MATQMLFYQDIAAVSKENHRDLAFKPIGDYGFAKKVNSVPLLITEFFNACGEFPIVFAGGEDAVLPHAIIGTRAQENLFVDADGKWQAKYVPAFIRQYPFVFAGTNDGKSLTLCIDESCPGFNRDGQGERFFDADGNQTMYLNNVIEFLQSYQASFQATTAFCKKIKELGLLTPMQASVTWASGEVNNLTGFQGIDAKKLRELEDDTVLELHKSGGLEALHAQLFSMQNFRSITELSKPAAKEEVNSAEEVPAEGDGSEDSEATANSQSEGEAEPKPAKKKAAAKSKAK
ncbi:MAG: SapC family protein [Rubripirellula sp.]|jgi:hypothetical protein|nr:SapC family protein [Planctomycetaceae bacterium]MDF1844286.1 SapC family protein [Rubripirellula sp.]